MNFSNTNPLRIRRCQLADLGARVLEAPSVAAGYQEILFQCAFWFRLDQAVRVRESRSLDVRIAAPTSFENGLQRVSAELVAEAGQHRSSNPMLRSMIQQRDLTAQQVSALISRREWSRNPFYHEVCIPMGMRKVMAVEPTQDHAASSRIHALVLGRDDRRGFSAADYHWLEQVRWTLRPILTFLERKETEKKSSPLTADLSPRERQVFHWLAKGKSNAEIAIILGCATRTVEKHVEHILQKTQLENRGAVIANCAGLFA